jgi:hypothetical protein
MEQNKPKFTLVKLHSQGTTAKAKEQFFSTRQTTFDENTSSSVDTKNVVLPDAAFVFKKFWTSSWLKIQIQREMHPHLSFTWYSTFWINSTCDIVLVAHKMT